MRNLTIKRTKSFVGCAVKVKIYIETETDGELFLQNVSCKKIGELKNGEEKTFLIDDGAKKVFVIADKLSKDFCNEYFQLPDGNEDIFLSGKNKFNPAEGNAFIFDNNDDKDVAEHHKANKRKGIIILACALLFGLILGLFISTTILSDKVPESKTFSSDGLTITLTSEFRETDIENYTVAFDSNNIAVFSVKEPFSSFEGFGDYSLDQYADLVRANNNMESSQVQSVDGLTYFDYSYTNPTENNTYNYSTYLYKSNDAFWIVQFVVQESDYTKYQKQIESWAKSVSFEN